MFPFFQEAIAISHQHHPQVVKKVSGSGLKKAVFVHPAESEARSGYYGRMKSPVSAAAIAEMRHQRDLEDEEARKWDKIQKVKAAGESSGEGGDTSPVDSGYRVRNRGKNACIALIWPETTFIGVRLTSAPELRLRIPSSAFGTTAAATAASTKTGPNPREIAILVRSEEVEWCQKGREQKGRLLGQRRGFGE